MNLPVEERIANTFLPSNIDASVSAENLQQELLGKYDEQKQDVLFQKNPKIVKGLSRCFKEINETKKSKETSESMNSKNKQKHMVYGEDKSLDEARLPPKPALVPVEKPPILDLVGEVRKLLHVTQKLEKPEFIFEVSEIAAYKNYAILLNMNFEIHKILSNENKRSAISYGSEFKEVSLLDNLMKFHPRWDRLRNILKQGSNWALDPLAEDLRKKDLEASLLRGNHKSAVLQKEFLAEALAKEVAKGWMLVLPLEKAIHIPNLIISPMGVVEQLGISETGDFHS